MKTLKNLKLRASVLGKAEMKQIFAGNYGGYVCNYTVNSPGPGDFNVGCSTGFGNACMDEQSNMGVCGIYGTVITSQNPCGCITW